MEGGLQPARGFSPAHAIPSPHPFRNRALRVLWSLAYALLFRPTPRIAHSWRRALLRMFGARLETGAIIYASVKIWAPWNLTMGRHACLGPAVDCYNVAPIEIGAHATVSQYSFLCTASHDITSLRMPIITSPLRIADFAWVCSGAFIGRGVTVGEGAVVGARSSVFRDVGPWTVVAGNPARFLKKRVLAEDSKWGLA
jgi:putative colanic acid biosynthesis acetyltransferase WcaF